MDSAFAMIPRSAHIATSSPPAAPRAAAVDATGRAASTGQQGGICKSAPALGLLAVGGALLRNARKSRSTGGGRIGLQTPQRVQVQAVTTAPEAKTDIDFKNLGAYSLGELEELYIDSLWSYYREGKPILTDGDFDMLKQSLYERDSKFPTLRQVEVAFVEAAIANYRGEPVVSDAEFQKLQAEVQNSGRRKDITAFLLFERGEQLLTHDQYLEMKEEVAKLGMTVVSIEDCSLAQLEEMYVDAIWYYYNEGRQILTDEQYDKLRQELAWQGSGFPCLNKDQIKFVEASLSYWRGQPIMADVEWKALKTKMQQDERNKEISALLLYTKGKQELDPKTFDEMAEEMFKLGVDVKKAGSAQKEILLSESSDKVKTDMSKVVSMYTALSAAPILICVVLVWAVGLFFELEFVPDATWDSVLSSDSVPLLLTGVGLGIALTAQLLNYLDLQNPQVLVCSCPSCGARVSTFVGGSEVPAQQEVNCQSCGTPMVIDVSQKRILKAGLGAKMSADVPTYEWAQAWVAIKEAVQAKSPEYREKGTIDPKVTFSIWDKDNSGTININEMRWAFKELKIDVSNKDLELLFREADSNGDGEIDYEEFFNMWTAAGKAGDAPVSKEYLKRSMSNLFRE